MKVWQPGGHLSEERGGEVADWSWRRTRRRIALLAGLALPYRARTTGALATLLAYTVVALAPPYLAKLAIDQGISENDLGRLSVLVALFLVAALAALVLSSANTYLTGWVGERMLADLRNRLFRHLERLSMGFYERNRTGVIVSRITNDVEALDQLVTDGVTSLVQNTLLLGGTAIVLFLLDWRLALATLAVLPAMGLVTAWFRSRSNRAYRNVRERLGLVTATLAEDVAGMRVVQSFTREDVQERAFRGVNDRYRAANYRTVVLNGIYFPAVDLLSSVATAIVFGYGGWLVYHGNMSTGTLFAFALYLANFFDPIQQLSQAAAGRRPSPLRWRAVPLRARAAGGPARARARRAGRHHRGARRPHRRRQVDHREAPRTLLRPDRGPDHRRRARATHGHAALAPLAARDRPPGGVPVRGHRRGEHRVRPPRRHARGDRARLVAFARALLADPRILILDEATSSVDIGTERRIERALRGLLAGRTAFVIAHRLSTIRDADLIVVLERGVVVERGTHEELIARRGLYTSLYGDWAADVA